MYVVATHHLENAVENNVEVVAADNLCREATRNNVASGI